MWMQILIQYFLLLANLDPVPDPGFWWPKTRKKCRKHLYFFKSKNCNLLILGLHKGRPSYRRILQPSKENIHHFKTLNFFTFFYFCGSFLPSWIQIWIRILNVDLDPATQIYSNQEPLPCCKQLLATIYGKSTPDAFLGGFTSLAGWVLSCRT
jgi:hypothetical protein